MRNPQRPNTFANKTIKEANINEKVGERLLNRSTQTSSFLAAFFRLFLMLLQLHLLALAASCSCAGLRVAESGRGLSLLLLVQLTDPLSSDVAMDAVRRISNASALSYRRSFDCGRLGRGS